MRSIWLLCGCLCFSNAVAAEQTLAVDPSRSALSFEAHTTLHDFVGVSPGAFGAVTLAGGLPVAGTIEVPVGRIRTGWDPRDEEMRSAKYLDAAKFPTVAFELVSFVGPPVPASGQAQGTLKGTLKVHGVAREFVVPVTYGWAQNRLEVSGSFPLDIRDFGVPPPVVFVIQRMDPKITVRFLIGLAPRDGSP